MNHLAIRGAVPLPQPPETPGRPTVSAWQDDFDSDLRTILNHLRVAALACRASARADLFEACAILSTTPAVAKSAFADVLMRCLGQALGKGPKFYRPGVAEVSFDETWLLRSISAARAKDEASLTFLIHSRVPALHRRNLGYLIGAVCGQFFPN